jgi:L-threonylcarbamoyladenylate synthase
MKMLLSTHETIQQAAALIQAGHLIGVPTETVYGLAADATNDLAVAKIFETKGRPQFNPLIVHVSCLEQARRYVEFTPLAEHLAQAFWPGPLTLVLRRSYAAGISQLVSAGLDTIAIRCPAHPVIRELIEAAGCPLAAPSANPSGRISPTTAQHVFDGFVGCEEPRLILDGGACAVGLESTVVDATGDAAVILRPGGLSAESIQVICSVVQADSQGEIASPGMLIKHYSPKHNIRLDAEEVLPGEVLLAFGPYMLSGGSKVLNLSPAGDLVEAAANLFSMLHQLDGLESDGIAVMTIPSKGLGVAINDRLKRAAEK